VTVAYGKIRAQVKPQERRLGNREPAKPPMFLDPELLRIPIPETLHSPPGGPSDIASKVEFIENNAPPLMVEALIAQYHQRATPAHQLITAIGKALRIPS
jgi:hypothetical protein